MIRNSLICKLINVQASMKEKKEKEIKNCDEISKFIKAFLDERDHEDNIQLSLQEKHEQNVDGSVNRFFCLYGNGS